jgi:hypothetical protein
MVIRGSSILRVIINGVTLQPITKDQGDFMLSGNQLMAFGRACYEITAEEIYTGVSGNWYDTAVQVDVLKQ